MELRQSLETKLKTFMVKHQSPNPIFANVIQQIMDNNQLPTSTSSRFPRQHRRGGSVSSMSSTSSSSSDGSTEANITVGGSGFSLHKRANWQQKISCVWVIELKHDSDGKGGNKQDCDVIGWVNVEFSSSFFQTHHQHSRTRTAEDTLFLSRSTTAVNSIYKSQSMPRLSQQISHHNNFDAPLLTSFLGYQHRGNGYATEAIKSTLHLLFQQDTDARPYASFTHPLKIQSVLFVNNHVDFNVNVGNDDEFDGAQAVLERLGFVMGSCGGSYRGSLRVWEISRERFLELWGAM
ncbi:hypothetical protein HDU76_007519 [Blyttiomyces sp. JEL0837]|nr:hypothetical protein HDU76_007519 [Blyttiomyces sp. JEL0837]